MIFMIIKILCFITGLTAGRKHLTYIVGASCYAMERTVIISETIFVFPHQHSTEPQHGPISCCSASTRCTAHRKDHLCKNVCVLQVGQAPVYAPNPAKAGKLGLKPRAKSRIWTIPL